jgi:hypothetical protein
VTAQGSGRFDWSLSGLIIMMSVPRLSPLPSLLLFLLLSPFEPFLRRFA